MAFIDRVVEFPNRVVLTPVSGETDTYDMTFEEGTVTAEGTPLNAANLNAEISGAVKPITDAITIDSNENVSFKNLQGGRVSTTVAEKTTKTINVTFPQAFDTIPRVVISAISTNPTQVHGSVSGITTTGFSLNVYASVARTCNFDWIALGV